MTITNENESTNTPKDVVERLMERVGIPPTRENYLMTAYLGNPPAQLGAEQEEELPKRFQR